MFAPDRQGYHPLPKLQKRKNDCDRNFAAKLLRLNIIGLMPKNRILTGYRYRRRLGIRTPNQLFSCRKSAKPPSNITIGTKGRFAKRKISFMKTPHRLCLKTWPLPNRPLIADTIPIRPFATTRRFSSIFYQSLQLVEKNLALPAIPSFCKNTTKNDMQ